MSERGIRDFRILINLAIIIGSLITSMLRGESAFSLLFILIAYPITAWTVTYALTQGQVNLWDDVQEWWNETMHPPKYPMA